jgi:hypothetical protein
MSKRIEIQTQKVIFEMNKLNRMTRRNNFIRYCHDGSKVNGKAEFGEGSPWNIPEKDSNGFLEARDCDEGNPYWCCK